MLSTRTILLLGLRYTCSSFTRLHLRPRAHLHRCALNQNISITRAEALLPTTASCFEPARTYSKKGKDKGDKGKDKGSKPKVELSQDELHEIVDFDKFKADQERIVAALQKDFVDQLTLRTAAGAVDQLIVHTDDGSFPLIQLAPVTQKNPQLMVINAAAVPQFITAIKKTLEDSGMNLNPQQDGTTIFVPIPKVTREHREGLVKKAKSLCDKTKDHLRHVQNEYTKKVKKAKEHHSEDLLKQLQTTIMSTTKDYNAQVEEMLKNKQQELLK